MTMFHEVESNYSGTCSHVPSQPARIPGPRAVPSCDRRLPLDTWNRSGSQENVFANPRSTLQSSQTPHRGIYQFATPRATGEAPGAHMHRSTCGKRGRTNWKRNPNADICWKSATMSFLQQRQQISELQFDKFPTPCSFLYWKIKFKNQVTTCSDFPSEAMLWIKEVEMVD